MSKTQIAHSERAHSDVVGGSTADRRINCPGSYQMEQKVPLELRNISSDAADEGTALHEAIQFILDENCDPADIVGREFNGRKITHKLVRDALEPAMDFFDALDEELDPEGGLQFLTEQRCQMPGIPDAFGTSDIVGRSDKRSVILDWKFGGGVPVKAEYVDEDGTKRVNAQLMFYARAAMHTCPSMFGTDPDWPVDLYICQPRARDADQMITKATVTVKQLEEFRMQLVAAVCEAQGENPRTKRGPWCRFADCKAICPHHTGPLLDLSKINLAALEKNRPGEVEPVVPTNWGELFGLYLPVCDAAEEVIRAVRAQAHHWLEQGHTIVDGSGQPNYKLVPKRAVESYVDEEGAIRHAIGLGASEDDIYEPEKLKSPAQLGKVLEPFMEGSNKKEREAAARKQISEFTSAVSSGTTLAPVDDKRPDVTSAPRLVNDLAKKLGTV